MIREVLILLAVLSALVPSASAQTAYPVRCYGVQVASMTVAANQGTNVISTSTTTYGARSIEIQNLDATVNLYCGNLISVSTPVVSGAPFNSTLGHKVPAAKYELPWRTVIGAGQSIYCVTDSLTAAANASVCAEW